MPGRKGDLIHVKMHRAKRCLVVPLHGTVRHFDLMNSRRPKIGTFDEGGKCVRGSLQKEEDTARHVSCPCGRLRPLYEVNGFIVAPPDGEVTTVYRGVCVFGAPLPRAPRT